MSSWTHCPIREVVTWMLLFAMLLPIVYVAQWSNLDLQIEDYYFDFQQQIFPWKNAWFAKVLFHEYIKAMLIVVASGVIGLAVLDLFRPLQFMNVAKRLRLRLVALSAILIPAVISLLKQSSPLHCPWDLARYGGEASYVRWIDMFSIHQNAGHCFPAGHASSGLWLAAFCVFWLPHAPKKALLVFGFGLGVGFALGWVQQMRGAHLLSHTLVSVWISAFIILTSLYFLKKFECKCFY